VVKSALYLLSRDDAGHEKTRSSRQGKSGFEFLSDRFSGI
jgi:hypothetical protein